jgi:hypothetical protein
MEELKNDMIQNESEDVKKIKLVVENLRNKKSKFLFCIPDTQTPVASVYEMFFQATTLKNAGYETYLMVEKGDYIIPTWIDAELTNHNVILMSNPKISVGPEDIIVIPDVFSNIMEQTKNLPCMRIGLLQSLDYMINALIPGSDWGSFGIQNILTTSDTLKNMFIDYYGNDYNIKTYDIGIPDYFKPSEEPQKPIISIVGRNANEISKFVKLFFAKYPQYNWITFDPMLTMSKPPQQMRRIDFAKRLQGNFAAVWIDRISSFGTFPVECMKTGTIPICIMPDIIPDYLIDKSNPESLKLTDENVGIWVSDFYELPKKTAEVIVKFLDDSILPEYYVSMNNFVAKYNQKNSSELIISKYEEFINERITLFENSLK